MKAKTHRFLLLLLSIGIAVIFFFVSGCSHETLKGKPVNMLGDAGRSNSFEQFGGFITYGTYTDKYDVSEKAGAIVPPLALSNEEFIYATTDGRIIAFIVGEKFWEKKLDKGAVANGMMCADAEQNSYIIDSNGMIYSFNYDGKLRWKHTVTDSPLGESTLPCDLLALSDGVLAGTTDGVVCKFSFEGKRLWTASFPSGIEKTLSAADDCPLLCISSENEQDTLAMLSQTGSVKWKRATDTRLVKFPVAGKSAIYVAGLRYVGEDVLSNVFAYDFSGNLLWRKDWSLVPRSISVAENGDIFVNVFNAGLGDQVSAVFKMNEHGKIIWKKFFRYSIPTPVMISETSLAYLGVTSNTVGLYFLDREKGDNFNVQSFSNELPIMHAATVRPDGAISFAYYQNIGFVRADEPWFHKFLPW